MTTIHTSQGSASARVPGAGWLLFAVFGAPFAWLAQLVVNYGFATYPCFPHGAARTLILPGWGSERTWLVLVSCVAVAIALGSLAAAWTAFGRARSLDREGGAHARRVSRTRSLAICGLISAAMFGLATLFTLAALSRIPQCSG